MILSPFRRRALAAALPLLALVACGDPKSDADATPAGATATSESPAATGRDAPTASGPASMEAITDLASSTVIHWSVVGDYSGDDLILNVGTSGHAPVTDHVEIGFDYTTEGNGGLTGEPAVTNFASVMGALRNGADGCRAPTVSGSYEHSTIEQLKAGLGGQLTMVVRTDYPAGDVPVACTGGNQHSPASASTTETDFIVPGIALLMMGDQLTGDDIRVSPDKRSLIVKRDGWTYTYTPSKVR